MGPICAQFDRQEVVLNQFVPPDREFLRHPDRMQGQYQTKSPIDGVERLYAWHRLHNYPLVAGAWPDHARALAATKSSIQTSLKAMPQARSWPWLQPCGLRAQLFLRQRRSHARLAQHRQRYQLAGGRCPAPGNGMVTSTNDILDVDGRWHTLMGTNPADGRPAWKTCANAPAGSPNWVARRPTCARDSILLTPNLPQPAGMEAGAGFMSGVERRSVRQQTSPSGSAAPARM